MNISCHPNKTLKNSYSSELNFSEKSSFKVYHTKRMLNVQVRMLIWKARVHNHLKKTTISRQSLPSLLGQIRASRWAQQEKQQICPCLRLSPNFCERYSPTAASLCSPHISVAHKLHLLTTENIASIVAPPTYNLEGKTQTLNLEIYPWEKCTMAIVVRAKIPCNFYDCK